MHTRRSFNRGLLVMLAGGFLGACKPECDRSDRVFETDPEGLLDLVPGLSYVVIGRMGAPMTDGFRVPNRPDGMGCFSRDGAWVLMRNHELRQDPRSVPPSSRPIAEAFDPDHPGSVTRVVLDPDTLRVLQRNLVLTGTQDNCGGGVTPHGWLSCEESTADGHGYVFLCDVDAESVQPAVRVPGYGRFKHEAAVFDPETGICYLTEDQEDACFYRFVPDDPGRPFGDGVLQALAVVDQPRAATTAFSAGTVVEVQWLEVLDPEAGDGVRLTAQQAGAAVFVRGEGAWFADGAVVFTCTEGGPEEAGQVMRLDVDAQTLEVLFVAEDPDAFNSPDGVTVAPDGRIYVLEDAECQCLLHRFDGTSVEALARTVMPEDELAGACFSPDGRVLFVNLMRSGVTLAILGLDAL